MSPSNRKVVAVAFDQLTFFEFGIAVEVFGLPRPEIANWYEFTTCSPDSQPMSAIGGMQFTVTRKGLRSVSTAGTIVIPGWRNVNERPPDALLNALRRANRRGARVMSFCSGAFVLAEAGLLNGRPATTHWRYANELADRFPEVQVNPDVLYVDDGDVLTAAGSAAGIDLCLHLVRRDFGAEVANQVARRLVVPPHREGGQAQFIARPVAECSDRGLARVIDWLSENLDLEHTVESMAGKANMSPRTFARRFRDQTGTTPARWLVSERIRHALHLLETTDLGMEQLATSCGMGSAQLLRFHFQKSVGSTPTAYRNAFRQEAR